MPEKILLVDDDKELREEFKDFLEGYQVIEAFNGQEALKLLTKPNEIGLIILDVKLPDVRGTDILDEVKRLAPRARVIILTAYGSKDVAIEALRGHADEFFEKPFRIEELKETIERFLDKKGDRGGVPADINAKVEYVKRFAERNRSKRVRLEDAAQAVALSPKYLSRVFRQIAGKRFSEYRLELKIGEAKVLLKKTALNINEIADKLGYQNAESFIRVFERFTGFTPTAFRKKTKSGIKARKRAA